MYPNSPYNGYNQIEVIGIIVFSGSVLILFYWILKRSGKIDDDTKNITSSDKILDFYRNKIRSEPNGDFIENILTHWKENYYLLESHHGYIQWLFPNHVPGLNQAASILTDETAEMIKNSPKLKGRVKRAFKILLDFYGMKLTTDNDFELAENHLERLAELNQWGNHNFLRITRILLALKELGHENLMLPWLKFLADLIYVKKLLDMAESSFEDFWIQTLNVKDMLELQEYLDQKGHILLQH